MHWLHRTILVTAPSGPNSFFHWMRLQLRNRVTRSNQQPQPVNCILLQSIGLPPQELKWEGEPGTVRIVQCAYDNQEWPVKHLFKPLPSWQLWVHWGCRMERWQRQRKESGRRWLWAISAEAKCRCQVSTKISSSGQYPANNWKNTRHWKWKRRMLCC